jgi:hypothetical protein
LPPRHLASHAVMPRVAAQPSPEGRFPGRPYGAGASLIISAALDSMYAVLSKIMFPSRLKATGTSAKELYCEISLSSVEIPLSW